MTAEGVIKYRLDFTPAPPPRTPQLETLIAARQTLFRLGLIGVDPDRYGGLAYGNVSLRNALGFIISASQTSDLAEVDARHFTQVTDWDVAQNRICARGPRPPSSESLTHAMLYTLDENVGAVLHVHWPEVWRQARALGMACTPQGVDYGSRDMALAVAGLFRTGRLGSRGVLAMLGHEDGLVAYGETVQEALQQLLALDERTQQDL